MGEYVIIEIVITNFLIKYYPKTKGEINFQVLGPKKDEYVTQIMASFVHAPNFSIGMIK